MGIAITFRALSNWPGNPTLPCDRRRSRFDSSWSKTIDLLEKELGFLNAQNVVIEADCHPSEIRMDGHLRSNAKLNGPGVVVSFDSSKGPLRFPCDTFTDWQANIRGIALGLEALRAVDRYGVTQHAEQYKGWTALPDSRAEQLSSKRAAAEWMVQRCHNVDLGFRVPTVAELIADNETRKIVYRKLAGIVHPDRNGGDETTFKQLQAHISAFEV